MNKLQLTAVALAFGTASVSASAQDLTPTVLQDLQKAQSEQAQLLATQERLLAETQHQHDQLRDSTYSLGRDVLSSTGNLQSQISKNTDFSLQSRQNLEQLESRFQTSSTELQARIEASEMQAVQANTDQARLETDVARFAAQTEAQIDTQGERLDAYGKLIVSNAGRTTQALDGVSTLTTKLDIDDQRITSNLHLGERNQQAITANAQVDTQQAAAIVKNQQAISANEQVDTQQAGAIAKNQQAITANAQVDTQQAGAIAKNQQAITANAQVDTQQTGAITKNQQAITANEQVDTQQAAAIASNQQAISANEQVVASDHGRLAKMQVNDKRQGNTIDTSIQGVNSNAQQIADNKNALAQVQERAVKDERAVLANSYAIAQDQQDIAANREAINKNSADIQDLRKDFEKMSKDMDGIYAGAAAFTGLVEPYGVGNLAVTAALGYHGDAQAIAVGVGERFNENLTAKFGGAYDTATKSTSAYIGVGYEF